MILWIATAATWAWNVFTPEPPLDDVDTAGTLVVAPFVIILAIYAGLMRIDPPTHRPRVLLAMFLDEEVLGERATAHSNSYTATRARVVLTCLRVGFPFVLTLCWIAPLLVENASRSLESRSPWWSAIPAFLLLLMAIGLVCLIPDLLLTGITWSRFWIGGWAGRVMIVLLGIALAGFVTYEIVAIVNSFRDGDVSFGWTLIVILGVLFLAHGVPALAASRRWSAWLPGYGNLALIGEQRTSLLSRYRAQLEAMLTTDGTEPAQSSTAVPVVTAAT